jgi:hypothetical protein
MQLTRRLAGYLALAAAAAAIAIPATRPTTAYLPTDITQQAGADARRNNCSGALGDWTIYAHANFGDLAGPDQADVVIVGDSLTTAGHPELATWLAARGKTLAGSYWSSRPTTPAVDWALSLSTKPKILVMASGTNDIFNPAVMAGQVARLKAWADTAPVTRLVWVDVQAARPATALCDQRNSGWINGQIRSGLSAGEVCGWSTGFAIDPNRIGNYLKPDGIHTIEGVGDNYRAAVIGNCIY